MKLFFIYRKIIKEVFCRLFLIIFFILPFEEVTADSSEETLRVVTESLPPYQIVSDQQKLSGYSVEIVRLLLSDLGFSTEIEVYPWARTYKIALTTANVVVFSIDRTPERENQFHWIGRVSKENYSFYKLKSRSDIQPLNFSGLKQYMIGVSRASSTDQIATRNKFPNLVRVHEPKQLVRMLHAGKIELAFAIDFTITDVYRDSGMDINLIKKIPGVFESKTNFYIALSKNSEPELVARFSRAYQKLKSSGRLDEIRKKWQM